MLGKSVENLLLKSREFLSHPGVRRYGSNTAWMFAEQILRMVAGFLVGVWVARYLGPEKFGLFSYALAFVAIFQGIAKLGLDGILVRDLVREPEKATVYLGTAFWLKLFGAVVTLLFIGLAIQFTGNDATANLYILIIASGLIFQSFEVIDFYFQSKVLAKYVSICKMVQLALSSLIKIFLILIGADLIWFVMVSLIDMVTLAITLNIAYKYNKNPSFYKYFDVYVGKRLLKDSWPLILVGMSVVIYERIDQIMLKHMLNDYSVGIYSAAVKVSNVFTFLSPIFAYSFFPALINSRKDSDEKFEKRLIYLYSFVFWFALFLAIVLSKFSVEIINIIYGIKFLESHSVLSIYIFTIIFAYMGGISSRFYIIENIQNLFAINLFIAASINIFLNFLFIPKLGMKGAAISSLISFAFSSFFSNIFFRKSRKNFRIQFMAIIFPFYFLGRYFKTINYRR